MKPRHLKIEGFLSYQQSVEIDFTSFDLACITGENGAGKSSILDAITWVLFGKARQANESLINLQSDEAVVCFSFEYSGESYKIRRSNKRGKPARLTLKTPELDLTERTTRDTQNKIEQILKIDYETFIHAVFFLQGDSDQFVSAPSGQRKKVLFDILGLDAWEAFRLSAAAQIKSIEKNMEQAQGSMQLLDEGIRRLPAVEEDLMVVEKELPALEKNLKTAQAALDEGQKKMDLWQAEKDELARLYALGRKAEDKEKSITTRLTTLTAQQEENNEIISRKEQIIKDYERSRELTQLLRDYGIKEIEHGKLQHALSNLKKELQEISDDMQEIPEHKNNIDEWEKQAEQAETTESKIKEIENNRIQWAADAENLSQKDKELLEQITGLEGRSVCPLCDQTLDDPAALISSLRIERDKIQEKLLLLKDGQSRSKNELEILRAAFMLPEVLQEKITAAQDVISSIKGAEATFDHGKIDEINIAIQSLDYDSDEGIELRAEADLVSYALRTHGLLEAAEKTTESLETQAADLRQDLIDTQTTAKECMNQIESKESLQEESSITEHYLGLLRLELNTAKTKVQVKTQRIGELNQILKSINEQQSKLEEIQEQERENTALHQKYSTLQEAFSKKGVPALLVEQALPQIESKANQLLHRLSDGNMAVHFVTQRAYSDTSREDKKETLDIEIQDQSGIRDYEMYSGGESFRINFAIRMALSHVLANRSGAKLRTLVIDEGFGSQDSGGRDRLINAINTIKDEYDKVLVITHIAEVIESFPVQLRVEKTSAGSQVRIL